MNRGDWGQLRHDGGASVDLLPEPLLQGAIQALADVVGQRQRLRVAVDFHSPTARVHHDPALFTSGQMKRKLLSQVARQFAVEEL
jgi:hypothetical protein